MNRIISMRDRSLEVLDHSLRGLGLGRGVLGLAVFAAGYLGADYLTRRDPEPFAEPVQVEPDPNAWALLCRDYETALREMEEQNQFLKAKLLEAGYGVETEYGHLIFQITLTAYSSTTDQTDETPFITASNRRVRPGILALSRDLLRPYNPNGPFRFGDEVEIVGVGRFRVEDTMNARWRRRGDVWLPSRREALDFGIREAYLQRKTRSGEG